MQNVKFIRQVRAQVNLTAEQWALYTSSMDCTEAAEGLNRMAEIAIAECDNASDAMKMMAPTMDKYSAFGAADSEPMWVLERLLDMAYGDEE